MPSKFIYLFLSSLTICFNCLNDSSFFFTYALNKGKNKASNFLNVSNDNIQYDDISSFSEELINAFSLRLKRVPELVLREKVAVQLAKAADNLNLPNPNEEVCEINYAELCPEGWSNFGDGESCLSPINYTGGCDKKVSFKNYTAINKYVFSIKCSISWPCINKCTQNYSEECPENWILINKNICKAPKNYKGKCIKEKMFSKFSESEKKIWAEKCDVNWPCYEKTYNLKVVCPIDWKIHPNNKSCIAPTSYIGPCKSIMYLHNLKDNEKLSLIKKCNIEWPIHEKKEVDLSSLCPIGWNITHVDNITCSAPSSYVGPCEKIISFENFSKEEKYEFSQKCDIHWPLLDQKLQNFNLPCPYNWNLLDEKNNICISPIEYQGPCENIFSFKNYNNDMKAAWASSCNTVFINDNMYNNLNNVRRETTMYTNKTNKIYGIKNSTYISNSNATQPSVNNGPIGYSGSVYEGLILNADDETVYLPSNSKMKYTNNTIHMNDIADWNDEQFILTDGKITDLLLLKESSNDESLRATIDATIKDLRARYSKYSPFSFLQMIRSGEITDDKHNINRGRGIANRGSRGSTENGGSIASSELRTFVNLAAEKGQKQIHSSSKRSKHDHEGNHKGVPSEEEGSKGSTKKDTKEDTYEDTDENIDKATDVDTDDNTVEAANNRNDVKNWYNNYKVENANLAYSGVCFEKNYMECPVGWTRINDKQCLASKSYAGRVRKCGSILNLGEVVKNMYDVAHDMSFVTADIEKRKKIEKDCNVQFPCIECERDYIRINCPLGWKEMNDGICEAPEDYPLYLKELCGNVVNFKYASANFKRKWSFLCKADWPCFSVCQKNYAHPCPLGYKLINERTDKYYKDHIYVCANENWKDYDQKSNLRQRNICHVIEVYNSIILKKEIEKKCKVIWPCLNICEENFYQSCPYNWLLKDNKCIAPYYYKPPKGCKNSLEIFTFNTFDKYLFSNKCFAPWPCKNSCQQDWTSPCPDGWTRLKAAEKKSKSKYNADNKYNEGSKHNDQGDDKIYDDQSEDKNYRGHSDDKNYRGHSDDKKYRGHSDDKKYRGHSDDKKYRGHSDDKKYRGHSDDKKYGHNDDKYDQSEDNKYKDHSDNNKYGHNDDKYDQSEDNKYKDHRDDNKYNDYHDDEKMNSSYFCKPPKTYKGACSEEYYNLADFTFSQKQDFSYRCSAKWPCGATLHHSENWQKENFYHDINFEKLKTIRFYDTFYSSQYSKYQTPFF
ncbi:CPW-WPC family protein, putative [Plasmodium malariae]|uniref:CPW-WPC family protein, putative n=1 Tax=Plasmodium malariae TaxID=5858 RepID=A0A1D3TF91_PLAMA|nr:CPW-WPC family protein, putative [Plasmodium malariae]SCP03629.1 CPW-WPC family protein, putative [Plasmodium malariae]